MSRKSSSTDATPIAASIASRSASVSDRKLTASASDLLGRPQASSERAQLGRVQRRMRISQPSPYASSFTVSGASTTAWFTSSTSPESGAIRSETALTDSTSPYGLSFSTVAPTAGGSKWTSSPSASCAYQVMPSTASSPSIRAQSCSRW